MIDEVIDEGAPGKDAATDPKPQDPSATWMIDASASRLEFAVKHFWGLMTVHGRFESFSGRATLDSAGAAAATLAVDAVSLETGNPRRDKHLRSADFFDVSSHSTLAFATTQVTTAREHSMHVVGELTIREHTERIEFDAAVDEDAPDHAVVDGTVVVDRTRFGMTWSPLGMSAGTATLSAHLTFVRDGAG